MHIRESGEMYLESIYILSQTCEAVRSIDVAGFMHFTKASVSRAVSRLKTRGFVTVDESGALILTDPGLEIARKTYEMHKVLTDFFTRIGVPPEIAAEDACKIEHDLSDVTFEALKNHAQRQLE